MIAINTIYDLCTNLWAKEKEDRYYVMYNTLKTPLEFRVFITGLEGEIDVFKLEKRRGLVTCLASIGCSSFSDRDRSNKQFGSLAAFGLSGITRIRTYILHIILMN